VSIGWTSANTLSKCLRGAEGDHRYSMARLEGIALATAHALAEEFPEDHDVVEEAFARLQEMVTKRVGQRQLKAAAAWEVEEHVERIADSLTTEPGPHYYYVPSTSSFVRCHETTYAPVPEDDVLADVLRALRVEPALARTKHKHKQAIMRRIRENTLIGSIPSSSCIQKVIGVVRAVLVPSKIEAKLLLTALGDGILRKSGEHIFVLAPAASPALEALREVSVARLGARHVPTTRFRHSYTPGEASLARAFRTHSGSPLGHVLLDQHALDIAVVAAHYSQQHGSAAALAARTLESHAGSAHALAREAWMAPSHESPETVVGGFTARNLVATPGCNLGRADLLFLWEADGHEHGRLLSLETSELEELLPFATTSTGCVVDCSSPGSLGIDRVLSFCREFLLSDSREYLLELSELHHIYSVHYAGAGVVTEEMFCRVLGHFAASVGLPALNGDNATLDGLRCTLWDKRAEVLAFFETEVGTPAYGLRTAAAYKRYVEWRPGSLLRVSRAYFWRLADEVGASS
jgi:hypothetical protein